MRRYALSSEKQSKIKKQGIQDICFMPNNSISHNVTLPICLLVANGGNVVIISIPETVEK